MLSAALEILFDVDMHYIINSTRFINSQIIDVIRYLKKNPHAHLT
jgi:hypothetical protein